MKKNLLFAGVLLAALPICAQEGPTFSASDPYPIFEQGFEFDGGGTMSPKEAFEAWQQEVKGEINAVQYYIHAKESGDNLGTNAKPWQDRAKWQKGPWRDTTLILRNDVMVADNPTDSILFSEDKWSLISEDRSDAFGQYGRTGGQMYFQYIAADTVGGNMSNGSAWGENGQKPHFAARYRRNLFVRGIEISDSTSYRITAYVTAHKNGEFSVKPTMYLDMMRGHFASEKSFTMTLNDNSHIFKADVEFQAADAKNAVYKEDAWNKVTFMTYYINDSIQDDFVFVDGYWWDAEWSWTDPVKTNGEEWNYIVQPDKYFFRVGFATDSTTFGIDDISLTKSWIGGCEYNGDKLRVNFGYDTNLKQLCEESYDKTGIWNVEIVGDYFEVWGRYEGDWERVPIRSAEYQKDGYMYMFTDYSEWSEYTEYADFNDYDSVLVSFTNPSDKAKRLVYNGSVYPCAWDTAWVNDGKPVKSFTNEPATKNPNVNAYSMKDLPPVMQNAIPEAGSFQLPENTRSLSFKFSKPVAYDNAGDGTELAVMLATIDGQLERWQVSGIDKDTIVTFTRPYPFENNLKGDIEFTLTQLYGANIENPTRKLTDIGDEVTVSYSFGPQPSTEGLVAKASFESIKKADKEANQNAPAGFSLENCNVKVTNYSGLFTKGLQWGILNVDNLSYGREASKNNCPKLSYGFNIDVSGDYDFQVVYARVSGDDLKMGVQVLDEAGNEIYYSEEKPTNDHKQKDDAELKAGSLDTVTVNLSNVAKGLYKFVLLMPDTPDGNWMNWGSWIRFGTTTYGFVLFSLTITEQGRGFDYSLSIGYPYTSAFANAMASLKAIIAKASANENQYGGIAYAEGKATVGSYTNFNNPVVTAPSQWTAATSELSAATKAIDDRIALVDEMWKQYGLLEDTLKHFAELELTEMGSYQAAAADLAAYKDVKASEITDDSIKAITKICQDAQSEMVNQYKTIEPYRATLKVAQDSVAGKYWVENDAYAALSQAVETAEKFNEVTSTSAEISAMQNELLKALFPYIDVVNRDKVSKLNMAALDSLASKLYTFDGDKRQDIADLLANRQYNRLGTFYKKAIKYAIYDKFVKGEDVDSLPVNALIKNNELYASVKVVDRMDKQMPANVGDLSKVDENGANIQHVRHQYNDNGNMPIWIMILTQDYTDLLFDWTVQAKNDGSNKMVTVDDANYANVSTQSFFNGDLGMDWTSRASLIQDLDELPVGMYSVGANFIEHCGNYTNITANERNAAIASSAKGIQSVDSVMVGEDGKMSINLYLSSESGWSRVDDFFMTFYADSTAEYNALASAALGELNEYPTFADASDEVAADVEYWTLSGIRIIGEPHGFVLRKTYDAEGELISSETVWFQ